ncbi:6456_t:CDS:2, partial [Dentiscutata erythropus]
DCIGEQEAHRGHRNICERPSPSKSDEGIIQLFGHKQRRLILVHCHNERTKVTVGQIKCFESEISNYPVNTLGIYVIDDDTFSKRSLTLANSNKNILLTRFVDINTTVSVDI